MSEKLFYYLYWRPYKLIFICIALVILASAAPLLLPKEYLVLNQNNYGLYIFKTLSWTIKFSMALYLLALVQAFFGGYFPKLHNLCSAQGYASVVDYHHTWTRGKQLCPVLEFRVGDKLVRGALNEAKGERTKNGDDIEHEYMPGRQLKIRYCPDKPELFHVVGEERYGRVAAVVRFVIFSMLFILELYLNVFVHFGT